MHPSDTSAEAGRVLTEVYRKMSMGQKWLMLREDFRTARMLHASGVRLRNPSATTREIHTDWMALNLGHRLPDTLGEVGMELETDNLKVVREVATALQKLDIPYALGGSMASSLHGMDRATKDADLTVEPFPGKESQFAASFGADYYVSVPAIQEAIRRRTCFNLINTRNGFKVDVFVRKDRPFEHSALTRRVTVFLPDAPEEPLAVVTAEDLILFKLEWYRLGNESSGQQWSDVLGVMKVQAGKLDEVYLDRWAADLKIEDLLARARGQLVEDK